MYPPSFDYFRAGDVDEALDLLQDHQDREAKLLAGGHSLLPMMKQRLSSPGVLIDIGRIDALRGIEPNGSTTRIGPLTTHAEIHGSEHLRQAVPVLSEAAGTVGDVQVRNRGTIGGNLAHADPASDLPAPFLALQGTVHVQGPSGERAIDAEDFFAGLFMTQLEPNEIITAFEVPDHEDNQVSAYVKNPSPSSGYAIVGVAAVLTLDDGTVASARVTANGAFDRPVRLTALEEALAGQPAAPETAESAAEQAGDGFSTDEYLSDLQASSEFREQLLKVYSRRAVETALERG